MLIDTLKYHRVSNMEYVLKKHQDLYLKHHDRTVSYLLYLSKMNENTVLKLKKSTAYKISRYLVKPFSLLKR